MGREVATSKIMKTRLTFWLAGPHNLKFWLVCLWVFEVLVFVLFMEQRLARSRCFWCFLFLSTLFVQVLSLSYKLPNLLST